MSAGDSRDGPPERARPKSPRPAPPAPASRVPSLETLEAQCDFEAYRSSGPGGQNVNRRETAVRLRHRPTGLVVACQEERSQFRNRRIALERLREKLIQRARRRRPRKPTAVPRAVRENILAAKKQRSETKQHRRKPDKDH
jgi:protein subunit release factor B